LPWNFTASEFITLIDQWRTEFSEYKYEVEAEQNQEFNMPVLTEEDLKMPNLLPANQVH